MLQPYADRILVKPDPLENKSAGGIHIPESAQAKQQTWWGECVASGKFSGHVAGDGTQTGVRVGDRILFSRFAGFKVQYEGVEYMLLPESDILAVEAK